MEDLSSSQDSKLSTTKKSQMPPLSQPVIIGKATRKKNIDFSKLG